MNNDQSPVWLKRGPAKKYYQFLLKQASLRDSWVAMIRERWAGPYEEGLALFPNIICENKIIPKSIDCEVSITQFTPINSSSDIFVYIHGGGWIVDTTERHLAWAKKIAHMTNMIVICVNYRLAPENPFPAALNDCITAYIYAREQTNSRVIVGGDSAGGNMASAIALYCSDNKLTPPNKILCLSTYSDNCFENHASMYELGIGNPSVEMSVIAFARAFCLPNPKDWVNPYASPIYGNLNNMPPTLILVGMDDPLRDDNLTFAKKLADAKREVTLCKFEGMPHTFFICPDIFTNETKEANQEIVKFMLN